MLTDGADWRLYHFGNDDALHEVARFELSPTAPNTEGLAVWLEGAPLEQRVLDPACGSGTFLFHAVRHYFRAAAAQGTSPADALVGATEHVLGIDIHPLAVTFARVTYLLAIGRELLLKHGRPNFHVPVFLGDSLLRIEPTAVAGPNVPQTEAIGNRTYSRLMPSG